MSQSCFNENHISEIILFEGYLCNIIIKDCLKQKYYKDHYGTNF